MDDKNNDILRQARERFDRALSAETPNREEALDDLKFLAPTDQAGQWPDQVKAERDAAGRPMLTINKLPQFVAQVANDMRMNRAAIKVAPVDDGADPELAEVMAGIIRNIERNSDAVHVYAEAGGQAAACGMGHFRVCTEYADDDTFDLDIKIKAIRNPFAVLWDPASTEYDRCDAAYCFVYTEMPIEDFKAKYPGKKTEGWTGGELLNEQAAQKLWYTGETVRVAEYWVKETKRKTLVRLSTGGVISADDVTPELEAFLTGEEREVDVPVIRQYLMTGAEVLEDPTEWPGRHIPIISVYGREVIIGERLVRQSVIRYAKDAQRLYNFWRTAEAEMVALAPKAPFVGTDKQFEGHEAQWNRANVANLPYLTYNPDSNAPPPQRQAPPSPSAAMLQEIQAAANDLHSTTGIYPPALGQKSNETSGRAILAREKQSDVGTFDFIDNLARSIAKAGRILIDLIPRIYDGTRVVRILGEDENHSFVTLNAPHHGGGYVTMMRDEKGKVTILPDLSAGKYDIAVSTGPSFSTKREESRESMMQFVQAVPQAASAVADLIAKAQDWPGSEEIAKRLRRMAVQAGVADPADDDPPPPPPPPDPKLIADARAKEADAAHKAEQTRGVALDNAGKELALGMQMGQLQAIIQHAVAQQVMQLLGPPGMSPGMPAQPGPMQPAPDPGGGLLSAPPQPMATPQGVYPEQ